MCDRQRRYLGYLVWFFWPHPPLPILLMRNFDNLSRLAVQLGVCSHPLRTIVDLTFRHSVYRPVVRRFLQLRPPSTFFPWFYLCFLASNWFHSQLCIASKWAFLFGCRINLIIELAAHEKKAFIDVDQYHGSSFRCRTCPHVMLFASQVANRIQKVCSVYDFLVFLSSDFVFFSALIPGSAGS
jgi:hypothetical protein